MKRTSVIARCPACGAKTKVPTDSERVSIRCPRCKVDVPLASTVSSELLGPNASVHREGEGAKSGRQPSKVAVEDFIYPDHTRPLLRRVTVFGLAVVAIAVVVVAFLQWNHSITEKYQDYFKNLRESIAAHQRCLLLLKAGPSLDENDPQRQAYRDAKAKIDFLKNQQRRHLTAPEDGSAEDLLQQEKALQDQLAAAERLSGQEMSKPVEPPRGTDSSASTVDSSTLTGPPAVERQPSPTAPLKTVEANTVVIALPGVTREQVTTDFLRRFADLADRAPGQATPAWAGDLLTVHVQPVADPARYAIKIRFGQLLYYSSKDRSLTLQLNADVGPEGNVRDPLTAILGVLKQRDDSKKLRNAVTVLGRVKALDRHAEVSATLEAIVTEAELDPTLRESALKLLPVWAGRDCIPLLQRLLDDPAALVKWAALDLLVEVKAVEAAGDIAKKWGKMDPGRVTQALVGLGAGVEPAVLPYLHNQHNPLIKSEVCKVLQEVGTNQSLKPLSDLINDKDQAKIVVEAARDAMKGILERK